VAAEAARLTGIENAIIFRNAPLAEPPPTQELTEPQAVRLALRHDHRVQASLAKVRVAEAEANQARLLPNPILTIDLRYPLEGGGKPAFEPSLSADLIAILQKPAAIRAADKRLRASAADALSTVLDVISEVQEAYSAARTAEAEIANGQRRVERIQRLRDLSQKRLNAGEGTKLDVLTLDAQLMQATLDLSDLELERATQRLNLAKLIGQPRAAAEWQLPPWEPTPLVAMPAESAWVDSALLNRPEIQSKRWELAALGDDLSAAALTPFAGGSLGAHGEHDPDWRLGPEIVTPLPIFDFGQEAREKIRAQQAVARHELAQEQVTVIQEVRLAYATHVHARQTLADAESKLLPLQRQQLEQAQLAYQAGEADLAILLLAQNDYEATLSKIIELHEKLTSARVKLERSAGGAGIAARLAGPATRPAPTTGPSQ
jgi:cobalt-zinc-cadmium efflux system outer membrane protein